MPFSLRKRFPPHSLRPHHVTTNENSIRLAGTCQTTWFCRISDLLRLTRVFTASCFLGSHRHAVYIYICDSLSTRLLGLNKTSRTNHCCSPHFSRLPLAPFPPPVQTHRSWLEGRQLRSNFGTTKYCATYLRNSPCSNPDCLYLHELGDEEDRFTKEEIQQRSLLAPPIPPGAVTVTGGGGPSGTGMRCNSPYLPPPVYQTSDSGSGAREGGAMGRSLSQGQHGAGGGATAAQRAATRGAKPTGQVCDVLWRLCSGCVVRLV